MSYAQAVHTRIDDQWGVERVGRNNIPLFGNAMRSLRNRARNLERQSVMAFGVLDRCVENVISTGIKIRPTSSVPAFNKAIKKLWNDWTKGKRADARRMLTWSQIQQLAYRAVLRDGDVGILLIDDGTGLSIQLIDANSIATPTDRPTRNIRDGVEIDASGRPVAYWVRSIDANSQVKFKRVEARDLIFYHRSPRFDVVRGESAFNGSFRTFENTEGYFEAVVVAARIGASAALIRRRKNRAPLTAKTEANQRPRNVPIEPGMINEIDSDDELLAFNPAQPTQQFPEAIRTFCRVIGLKFGLTVQRVLLDFSSTNYSVSRSTALQEQRFAEPEQLNFVESVLRRIYQWFVSKMIKLGLVVDDKGKPIAEPDNSWEFEWVPPARPLVEPAKDAPGLKMLVDMNVESYRNIAESFGYELDQLMDDNAVDVKKMKELGLYHDENADTSTEDDDDDLVDDEKKKPKKAEDRARRLKQFKRFLATARALNAAKRSRVARSRKASRRRPTAPKKAAVRNRTNAGKPTAGRGRTATRKPAAVRTRGAR